MSSGRLSHLDLCSSTSSFYCFSQQPWLWVLFNDLGGFHLELLEEPRTHLAQASARVTLSTEMWQQHGAIRGSSINNLFSSYEAFLLCRNLPPNEGKSTHLAFLCKKDSSWSPLAEDAGGLWAAQTPSDCQCHPHSFRCHFKVSLKTGTLSDMWRSF